MDGQPVRLSDPRKIDPPLDRPTTPADPPAREAAPPARVWTRGLSEGWALVLGLGWPLVWLVMPVFEPAPTNPEAVSSFVVVAASIAFYAGLLATSVLAGTRNRAAAPAAVFTGLVTVAMVVSCPVSGHHQFGAWWLGEMALVLAMLAVSVVALRETAHR